MKKSRCTDTFSMTDAKPEKVSGIGAFFIIIFVVILFAYLVYAIAVDKIKAVLYAITGMHFSMKNDSIAVATDSNSLRVA